jgi:hypothetical protein
MKLCLTVLRQNDFVKISVCADPYSGSVKFRKDRPFGKNCGNFGVRKLLREYFLRADPEILLGWRVRKRRNRFYIVSCVENLYILKKGNLSNMAK